MPNVVRGGRMAGLLAYLVGPGRHNEHTEPHLVGGDGALMTWHGDEELNHAAAMSIAKHLDRPRTLYGTEITAGVYERRQTGTDAAGQPIYKRFRVGSQPAHVWHCSLSLRADEGELSDDKWGAIAADFVKAMGFDDQDGSKAPCRWTAVRHGVSTEGNDHVHLVVNLVREDGTKAAVHKDFQLAQKAARAIEVMYGLERLESSLSQEPAATRGFTPGEQSRAERVAVWQAQLEEEKLHGRGAWARLDPAVRRARVAQSWRRNLPRVVLARKVRACATAAADEAEFVRRARRSGLLIRPRFAVGTQDVITGYSVAERPARGDRPVWYGGGRLARDLTLISLRQEWPDDPFKASEAAAEWNAAYRGRRPAAPGRETSEPTPQLWAQHAVELDRIRRELAAIPTSDRDTWPVIARQTAGVLSAWSLRLEAIPGELAAAADLVSRSAQTYRRQPRPPERLRNPFRGAALLVAAGTRRGVGPAAEAALLQEIIGLCLAIAAAARQANETRHAARLRTMAAGDLDRVHARLSAAGGSAATATLDRPAASKPAPPSEHELDPELRDMINRIRGGLRSPADATSQPLPNPLEPPTRPAVPGRDDPRRADRGAER